MENKCEKCGGDIIPVAPGELVCEYHSKFICCKCFGDNYYDSNSDNLPSYIPEAQRLNYANKKLSKDFEDK